MLSADPAPSYEEIGAALGMPIGSIGPTRARALKRLRRAIERLGVPAAEALR
jgi:DNA-directed RNA polymerase specialized sigma24 family protein